MKQTIFDKLKNYSKKNIVPMHMPGHKRHPIDKNYSKICKLDITEIDGFDNLHAPESIIMDAEIRAAKLYDCKRSFFLVGGSTCGILSCITAVCNKKDKIIVARNCHKSVYNAIELNELDPYFIFPEVQDGIAKEITPENVEKALLSVPDASLVIITSPTYEGIMSDIEKIAEITHKFNVPLMVDSAHGAHLKFLLPDYKNNADITVTSLHKTLPVLNQGALLNLRGNLVSEKKIADKLSVFQTSSPSYIIMASMDSCISMLEKNSKAIFKKYINNIKWFESKVSMLQNLKILFRNTPDADCGKIIISGAECGMTGVEIQKILRDKFFIELEMSYGNYALAMTSVCDSKRNFKRLAKALLKIDKSAVKCKKSALPSAPKPERCKVTTDKYEFINLSDSLNRVSAEYVFAYPPGIPIIAPGEIINSDVLEYFNVLKECKTELKHSISDKENTVAVFEKIC